MSRPDILATTKAVAFAEDALFDTSCDFAARLVGELEYLAVYEARQQVRRIAAAGVPAVESP